MPVFINKDTGLAESVQTPDSNLHEIPLVAPDGTLGSAPATEAAALIKEGYKQPDQKQLGSMLKEAHFNEPMEQLKTGLEGAADAATFGLSTGFERALGAAPEDIQARREANPGVHTLGQAAGLIGSTLTGMGEGAALAKAGAAIPEIGTGIAGKIATSMGRGAVENALFQAGDETSKLLMQDPDQRADTAIAHIGLSSLLGAGVGGALGSIGAGFGALEESKIGQFVNDFKGRLKQHLENPEPLTAVQDEVQNYYTGIKGMADEVYGPTGLKAQEIAKTMPEFSPKITEQAVSISKQVEAELTKMEAKPNLYPERLTSKLRAWNEELQNAAATATDSGTVFNAIQDLKQNLQGYSKFGKFVKPFEEPYDFVQAVKGLGHSTREALEDTSIWGKAATRQKEINKAFVDFLPSLQDFEKKFTAEVGGERVIDPGKLNTYMNQLGKPNAELKQEMMANFIKAADKYKAVLEKTHANLGLEAPDISSTLNFTRQTLDKVTPGAKSADALLKHGIGKMFGAGTGAAMGSAVGHPFIGAALGERLLSPTFDKLAPAILKPLLEMDASGAGLKSAMDYTKNVLKGEAKLDNVIKGVFGASRELISEPSAKELDKLQQKLDRVAANPQQLMDAGGQLGHYMPEHATALGMTAAKTVQYLGTLKPEQVQNAPLDAVAPMSKTQTSTYKNAMQIAQQPLLVMGKIKDGSLSLMDVEHLKAMYPGLYASMSSKLMEQVMDAKTAGKTIPFRTIQGLSLFFGQPLTSSLKQANILANQTALNSMGSMQQPMEAPQQRMPHNLNKLDKLSGQNSLPGQTRERYRSTGHR